MQLGPMHGFGVAAPAARRPPPPRGARATMDQHRIRRSFELHIPVRCLARWQPRKVHPTLAGTAAFRLRAEYSPARQLVAIVTDTSFGTVWTVSTQFRCSSRATTAGEWTS
eukprot:340237-Chlamydomonas_euryale.AAC.1